MVLEVVLEQVLEQVLGQVLEAWLLLVGPPCPLVSPCGSALAPDAAKRCYRLSPTDTWT